jgi:hypothetical protein
MMFFTNIIKRNLYLTIFFSFNRCFTIFFAPINVYESLLTVTTGNPSMFWHHENRLSRRRRRRQLCSSDLAQRNGPRQTDRPTADDPIATYDERRRRFWLCS